MKSISERTIVIIFGIILIIIVIAVSISRIEFGEPYGIQILPRPDFDELGIQDILLIDSIPPAWRKQTGSSAQFTLTFERELHEVERCEYGESGVLNFYRVDIVATLTNLQTNEIILRTFEGQDVELIDCDTPSISFISTVGNLGRGAITHPQPVEEWLIKELTGQGNLPTLDENDIARQGLLIDDNSGSRYTPSISSEWIADNLERPRYLLLLNSRISVIEECNYSTGVDVGGDVVDLDLPTDTIIRFRRRLLVTLFDLELNSEVDVQRISGAMPDECPQSLAFDERLSNIFGDYPEISDFENWLMRETDDLPALVVNSFEE